MSAAGAGDRAALGRLSLEGTGARLVVEGSKPIITIVKHIQSPGNPGILVFGEGVGGRRKPPPAVRY